MDERLSDNFTLAEMVRTTASHLDNTPSPAVIAALRATVTELLQPIRDHFGRIRVTSGYRSPAVNRYVHGAKNSDHIYGRAVDFIPLEVEHDLFDVARWIAMHSRLDFDQLILEFIDRETGRGGWLHASYRSLQENRNEILVASRDRRGATVYTPILAREIPRAKTEAA